MRLTRLRLLERAVQLQPRELFNMWNWRSETKCGTVCCAAGSYAYRYPGNGLKFRSDRHAKGWFGLRSDDGRKDSYVGYEACAVAFGMTKDQAWHLFAPSSYSNLDKSSVLRRIRSYIRKAERERAGGRKAAKR